MRASIGADAAGIAGHSCQSRSLAEPTLLGTAIRHGNEHIGPTAAIECFHRVAQPDSQRPLQQELPIVPIDESSQSEREFGYDPTVVPLAGNAGEDIGVGSVEHARMRSEEHTSELQSHMRI